MSINIRQAAPAIETSKTSSSKAPETGQAEAPADNRLNAADMFISRDKIAQERTAETAKEADPAKTDYEKQGQSRIDNIFKQMDLASRKTTSEDTATEDVYDDVDYDEEYAGEQVSAYAVDDSVE